MTEKITKVNEIKWSEVSEVENICLSRVDYYHFSNELQFRLIKEFASIDNKEEVLKSLLKFAVLNFDERLEYVLAKLLLTHKTDDEIDWEALTLSTVYLSTDSDNYPLPENNALSTQEQVMFYILTESDLSKVFEDQEIIKMMDDSYSFFSFRSNYLLEKDDLDNAYKDLNKSLALIKSNFSDQHPYYINEFYKMIVMKLELNIFESDELLDMLDSICWYFDFDSIEVDNLVQGCVEYLNERQLYIESARIIKKYIEIEEMDLEGRTHLADLYITSDEIAVGLRYNTETDEVPVIVEKLVDLNVDQHFYYDDQLAVKMFATQLVGEYIEPADYKSVAEIFSDYLNEHQ